MLNTLLSRNMNYMYLFSKINFEIKFNLIFKLDI